MGAVGAYSAASPSLLFHSNPLLAHHTYNVDVFLSPTLHAFDTLFLSLSLQVFLFPFALVLLSPFPYLLREEAGGPDRPLHTLERAELRGIHSLLPFHLHARELVKVVELVAGKYVVAGSHNRGL